MMLPINVPPYLLRTGLRCTEIVSFVTVALGTLGRICDHPLSPGGVSCDS